MIQNVAPKPTREQKSYAYFKRARNYYCLDGKEFDPDAAFKDYAAAVRVDQKAPWADIAMFLAANIQWNHKHNADAAIALWKRLIRTYPDSGEVERSAYFVGLAYKSSKRVSEAIDALQQFVTKHPGSRFAASAREEMAKLQDSDSSKHRSASHSE